MPFSKYQNFEDCVLQNSGKSDPKAYCAKLHFYITGEWPVSKKDSFMTITASTKEAYAVGSLDWVREQARKFVNELNVNSVYEYDYYAYVHEVFSDSVVVDFGPGGLFSFPYSITDSTINFGVPTEVKVEYVQKGAVDLSGPIVHKNSKKQIAYAAVLVPGEPDSDGDVVKKEKIEEVAHDWLSRYTNIDLVHNLENVDAVPVESYITPVDISVTYKDEVINLPAGTWIMATKIRDNEVWKQVEDNKIVGYSIMAKKVRRENAALKSNDDIAVKRMTLRDLEDDWIVPFVSLATDPAVPKSKFFALKNKNVGTIDKIYSKVMGTPVETWRFNPTFDNMVEKEGRKFSKTTLSKLKAAYEELTRLLEEAEEEEQSKSSVGKNQDMEFEMTKEEMQELLQPITSRLEALEASLASQESSTVSTSGEDTVVEDNEQNSTNGNDSNTEDFVTSEQLGEVMSEFESFKQEILKVIPASYKTAPRTIRGQDTNEAQDNFTPDVTRDSFGRVIRKYN